MAVDVWATLRAGGREALRLLEFSVISIQLEPVFGYLVAEYRNQATAQRAVALYDVFCAGNAPARIHAASVLPPQDHRLLQDIQRIRDNLEQVEAYDATQSAEHPQVVAIPPKYLFDRIRALVESPEHEVVRRIQETYDPELEPVANLPGGKLTAGQRQFVDFVWRPRIRPCLVQAGFPRVATIGG